MTKVNKRLPIIGKGMGMQILSYTIPEVTNPKAELSIQYHKLWPSSYFSRNFSWYNNSWYKATIWSKDLNTKLMTMGLNAKVLEMVYVISSQDGLNYGPCY